MDEGYVTVGLPNSLVHFAKLLSVERVWIVTGTPTTNLLPLAQESELELESDVCAWYEAENGYGRMKIDDMFVDESTSREGFRVWGLFEDANLRKIENMIAHFLQVPQFHADSELFETNVRFPLLNRTGPGPGSIQVLIQVMGLIIIRHR